MSVSSLQMNFGIAIHNPIELAFYFPNSNFQVYINNQYLGRCTFGSMTIGGSRVAQMVVPLTVSASDFSSVLYG